MRFTNAVCVKKNCNNFVRSGFRFCYRKDCGSLNTSPTTPMVNQTNEEE